jgi:hypothetical protein
MGFVFHGRESSGQGAAPGRAAVAPGRCRGEQLTIGVYQGSTAEAVRQGAVTDVPPLGPKNPGGGRCYLFAVFMLSCPPREDPDSRIETLGDFSWGYRPKGAYR